MKVSIYRHSHSVLNPYWDIRFDTPIKEGFRAGVKILPGVLSASGSGSRVFIQLSGRNGVRPPFGSLLGLIAEFYADAEVIEVRVFANGMDMNKGRVAARIYPEHFN